MTQELQTINETQALQVLGEIDEINRWCQDELQKIDAGFMRLATLLLEAKRGAYWTLRGLQSEEEYIHSVFPQSRAQYYNLLRIAEHLGGYPKTLLEDIGVSKCQDLVRVKVHSGELGDDWFDQAKEDDKDTFRRRVRAFISTGHKSSRDPKEEDHFITFRLFGDMIIVVNKALEIVGRIIGSDKSMAYRLEMIAANFLSQFDEDEQGHVMGKNSLILLTIQGLLKQLDFDEKECGSRLCGLIATAADEWNERHTQEKTG